MAERRHPDWIKVRAPSSPEYLRTRALLTELKLHSVCQEACCPNIGECFSHRTATFMLMGDVCTRNCPYCAVTHGRARPLDPDEPRRIAEAVERLGLQHVVVTSVDRDDLPDGGAAHFAATASAIKSACPPPASKCWCPTSKASTRASRPSSIRPSISTTTISRPCRASIANAVRAAATNSPSTCSSTRERLRAPLGRDLAHQGRHHARARRGARRTDAHACRSAHRRMRYPDARAIPAALARSSAGGALCSARGIRRNQSRSAGARLSPRRIQARWCAAPIMRGNT